MRDGIVLELQRDALNSSIRVSDLLRKANLIAKKLQLPEFLRWIELEMGGYVGQESLIPGYRTVHGRLVVRNPVYGFVESVFFVQPEVENALSIRRLPNSLPDCEHTIINTQGEAIYLTFSPEAKTFLKGIIRSGWGYLPLLEVHKTQFENIVDAVRNALLDWTLKLEQDGIIGKGHSFTVNEKERAAKNKYSIKKHIKNYTVQIQSAENVQIQQNSRRSVQKLRVETPIDQIKDLINAIGESLLSSSVPEKLRQEILAELATLQVQADSPKPKKRIISESLRSLKHIFEGTAGNVFADHIGVIISLIKAFT